MEIVVVEGQSEMDQRGAEMVAGWLASAMAERGRATLMAALGTSALGIYAGLAERFRAGDFDASHLTVVQLDEYLGIGVDDRRSLRGWLQRDVVAPLYVRDVIELSGEPRDPAATCRAYDVAVESAGGIDVAVLGLGPNGHLGFNEPPSGVDAPTRVVQLAPESIVSNARYWGSEDAVPRTALTAGMSTILGARRILLVVSGASKRAILHRVLVQPPSAELPASLLRPLPHATLLADRASWPPDVPW